MQRLCWIIQADSVQSRGPLQEEDRRVGVRVEVVTTEGEVRGQRERLEDPILLPLRGGRSRKLRSAGGPRKLEKTGSGFCPGASRREKMLLTPQV